MDRLPPLTRAALLTVACGGGALLAVACGGGESPPAPSRVDAVAAAPRGPVDLDAFCEARPAPDAAPTYAWPTLVGEAPAPAQTWTWVNLWATWCGPCIAEMPMITKWPAELAARGTPVELRLLSVDEDAAALHGFVRTHAEAAGTLHMAQGGQVSDWVRGFGLDVNEALPLHLLVDPQGRIRCARSGAVAPDAIEAIEALVRAG